MRHLIRLSAAFASVVALSSFSSPARAQNQKPTSTTFEYSPYEREAIKKVLEDQKSEIDLEPEGKIIERIDVVRLEVLEERDPVPEQILGIKTRNLLNSLHTTTREFVIRREMLLEEGQEYQQVVVDETARNLRLRRPLQLSLVVLVPMKTETEGKVRIVMITKDIWSLRLSFETSVTPGGLESLVIVPQETNLAGLHHTAQTRFVYQPESYTFGMGYSVPRIGKTWIAASAGANVYINKRELEPEGSAMSASVGQGLYSTRTEWAWGSSVGYSTAVSRLYTNAALAVFAPRDQAGNVVDRIPVAYRSSSVSASASVTRSFGWALKNNFSLSLNAGTASVEGIGLEGKNPSAVAAFRRRFLPVGEDRIYPALSWATFRTDFLRTLDINTLALQEDYRLGHDVAVTVYPIAKAVGSSRDVVGISAGAGYAIPMGDGLVRASVGTVAENDLQTETIRDGSVSAAFGAVTPRIGFGRIVMNTSFVNRYRNYLNGRTITGGDDRLRGYPTNFFVGKDAIFYNIEFRTTSVEVLKCAFGAVAFFDAGDAAQGFDMLRAKQSAGVGVRALFPQVNRLVFRADLAFPLKRGPFENAVSDTPVDPVGFYFTFDQAFGP